MSDVAAIGVPTGVSTGLRPFNPIRDLPQVTALLARVFGPELAAESGSSARLVRWMARFPAVGWMWMGFDAWFDGSLGGYVWVCDDRVVANASIAPISPAGWQWVLSNVAVAEEYRDQGIGRRLVEACLSHAWLRGAHQVLLQVWQANEPARHLYDSLGFRAVSRLWRLATGPEWPPATCDGEATGGLAWRPWRGRDLEELRTVALAMTPYELRVLRPSPLRAFQPGPWEAVSRVLLAASGRVTPVRRMLWRGDRLLGGLALIPVGEAQARLTVVLPPDPPQGAAAAVVAEAARLSAGRDLALVTDLPETLDVLRRTFLERGFEERDALLQMSLDSPFRPEWELVV